ncbi:MAG: hypothetical protein WBM13_01720 [Bacteroidia bacterium]
MTTDASTDNSLSAHKDSQKKHRVGWISIYRSLQDHWIWNDDKKLKWWLMMLFEVNHSDNKFILGYEIFEIKRGQSANSLRIWARLFNTTPKTVSKFFALLKKDEMIKIETIGKGKQSTTLISIMNYNDYQSESKRKVIHEVSTNNKDKNKKKDIYNRLNTNESISLEKFSNGRINTEQLSKMFDNISVINYINSGVRNYITHNVSKLDGNKTYTITQQQTKALINVYLSFGLNHREEYKTVGNLLKHCINWIGHSFTISEIDANKNYKLSRAKLFWDTYNETALM